MSRLDNVADRVYMRFAGRSRVAGRVYLRAHIRVVGCVEGRVVSRVARRLA